MFIKCRTASKKKFDFFFLVKVQLFYTGDVDTIVAVLTDHIPSVTTIVYHINLLG